MADGPFATGVPAPADDPFAATAGPGEFEQGEKDPFDDGAPVATAEPVPGVPVVGADGEPVETGVGVDMARQEVAAEREATPGQTGPDGEALTADGSPAEAQDAGEDPQSAPTDGGATASSVASTEKPASDLNGAALPAEGSPAATPPPTAVAPETEGPEELKDKNDKVTHRRYLVFRPTGAGKYEQVSWHEDAEGNIVPKGTEGARRKKSCLVRSKEDALATGYLALGAPPEGLELVAVTANYWKLRKVAPAPVVPTRARLSIK